MQDFVTVSKLGGGSYGQVYKVRRITDGQQYAMKKVKLIDLKKDKDRRNALNQIRILASIDHPRIVQYKEAFFEEESGELCVVMELASEGDLAGKIKERFKKGESFYEAEVWRYGLQILQGLKQLHSMQIIHRDLKPANIFFSKDDGVKIGDLNVSLQLKDNLAHTQTGTPNYASPEVWNNQPYSFDCDVWSFGCILYEMCCFKPPFRGKNIDDLYKKVQAGKYDKIPVRYSLMLEEAIGKCLVTKKAKRAKVDQLIEMFRRYTHLPKQNRIGVRKNKSCVNLMATIQFPKDKRQLAAVLPSPKYIKTKETEDESPQQCVARSLNKKKDKKDKDKDHPLDNILDRFMRDKPSYLRRQRLNNRAYVEDGPKISHSYKQLPHSCQQLGQQTPSLRHQEKQTSFKQILKSIEDEKMMAARRGLARMNLKRRNIKLGSYLKL